jgi:hypothetical protein
LKFGPQYEKPKQIKITLKDKFINDMYLTEDYAGNMICAGFYRTKYKSANADGAFLSTIQNDSVSNATSPYFKFPAEVIKQFEKKSTKKKVKVFLRRRVSFIFR